MPTYDFTQIGLKKPQKIVPMETGSCSINYYVKNEDGEFLGRRSPILLFGAYIVRTRMILGSIKIGIRTKNKSKKT